MATTVHIFSHAGVVQVPLTASTRKSDDASYMLKQPYLAREVLSATGSASSSSANTAPAGTTILLVQVADAGSIRYEVNAGSRSVTASSSSPRMSGEHVIEFPVGATLSIIEA